ncbi:MAG: citrate synthase [Thermoguttaceae bacterium]|nr:citrate synthase [Thermoguttaceae bacterium]MBR2003181.1 citrate synthase [Thermoguttaceae bacterium]
MSNLQDKAKLLIDGKEIDLNVYTGVEGERAVDVTSLHKDHGLTTYDPSLGNTAICRSSITYIDGDRGVLRYRGIPIEQFDRPNPNFIEVAWALIFGRLPDKDELAQFSDMLTEHELLHEGLRSQFQSLPVDAPPMAILSAMIGMMSCYHKEFLFFEDEATLMEAAARVISKVRTIAAFTHRRASGLPFIYPDPSLRYCANFLHMMFSIPYRQYEVAPEIEDALNLVFILHADHEQNCSANAVRVVCSAQANLFASCSAGVNALWGPLHGGANVKVMEMLERIHKGGMRPEDCLEAAKDKTNPFRLFGFGHRVYRNYDPRAKILKTACDRVFDKLKLSDPLLDVARKLEEKALKDPYFVDRKLYPNVDFYSGILLRAMGIPTDMFTVMFAIGRLPGWIAQWKEQHFAEGAKIMRPRQLYVGNPKTDYIEMEMR